MRDKIIGVFTVKRVLKWRGQYYTNGGFGVYINDFSCHFKKCLLFARVVNKKPQSGFYRLGPNIDIVRWVNVRSELGVILTLPINFFIALFRSRELDMAQIRLPDYHGVLGFLISRIRRIPFHVVIIADWAIQAKGILSTRKFGLGFFLKIHLLVYDRIERFICTNSLVFAQGNSAYSKHESAARKILKIRSSAYSSEDVVNRLNGLFKARGKVSLITIGRLDSVKNQEFLIKAIAELNASEHIFSLKIVGDGPQRNSLEKVIVENGLEEQVHLLGAFSREKLWEQLDSSDIFVFASRSEGTPKVLMEAMARGIPVLATKIPGCQSIIKDGINGFLYELDSLHDFEQKLFNILENDQLNVIRQNAINEAMCYTLEECNAVLIKNLDEK